MFLHLFFLFLFHFEFKSWIIFLLYYYNILFEHRTSLKRSTLLLILVSRTKFEICETHWITHWRTTIPGRKSRGPALGARICVRDELAVGLAYRLNASIRRIDAYSRPMSAGWNKFVNGARLDGGWQNDILVRDNWKTSRGRIIRATRIPSPIWISIVRNRDVLSHRVTPQIYDFIERHVPFRTRCRHCQ